MLITSTNTFIATSRLVFDQITDHHSLVRLHAELTSRVLLNTNTNSLHLPCKNVFIISLKYFFVH